MASFDMSAMLASLPAVGTPATVDPKRIPAFTAYLAEEAGKTGKGDTAAAIAGLEGFAKLAATPAAEPFLCHYLPVILAAAGKIFLPLDLRSLYTTFH